ncbi:membrane protein [Flexivirga endophytica]|uniref:Membrane protein n=1 Tax=Flexivirga endophytica TaxID=1849103 RepID=A0A916SX24_9MICO|nr:DUF58 domain-containing protein [Flexivirga endophytica]GGB18081.1 membrane protein [Flexivirga endophytica]GHB37509.1 membrane protein [Flexivirga endophytica]
MAEPRRHTFTGLGRGFVSAGIVLTGAGLFLGFEDIVRVGVLLVVLALLALVFARRAAPRIDVHRTVTPPTAIPDERTEVRVTFTNIDHRSSRLYLAEERIDYVLGDRPRFVVAKLEPGASREVSYVVRSHLRGRYTLGPVLLTQREPFGLTHVTGSLQRTDELLVLPRVVPLGATQPPGSGIGNDGETPQMVALHGEDDVSIRNYHDGDDLRKVHWPATAHRGELMVRQEDRPARRSALVLLDPRETAHDGTGAASSFEWAVSAVASIVVRLDELGYRTQLVTREALHAAHADLIEVPTQQMVVDLASAALGSDQDFTRVLSVGHDRVGTGGLVTAVVAAGDDDTGAELAGLRQPGAAALGFVLDSASFGSSHTDGPSEAAVRVRDRLAGAGWRVVIVDAHTPIAQAWATVTNKALVQVGSL